jgi:hypothetical protein
MYIICLAVGPEMLRSCTGTHSQMSGNIRIRIVITEVTYARDTFEGYWSLEWTV